MYELDVSSELIEMNLMDVVSEVGEYNTKILLQQFQCVQNPDVQTFIRDKAIQFSKQGLSQTHLVYSQITYKDIKSRYLVGYYTLANKNLTVYRQQGINRDNWDRIKKFGKINPETGACEFPALLIAQLGKNYADGNDSLITGTELLNLAVQRLNDIQKAIGGKFIYLECEDKDFLISFYEKNGFVQFGKRKLDHDETDINGEYLVQLFRYFEYDTYK